MSEDTDLEALVPQLPKLRSAANRWREREAEAGRKAEGYEAIIRGIESVLGSTVTVSAPAAAAETSAPTPKIAVESNGSDGPRGIAAVRRVMADDPERIWKARDIHDVMDQRGWISPGAQHPLRGTEAAINRLMHRGEVERVRAGRYRATPSLKRSED